MANVKLVVLEKGRERSDMSFRRRKLNIGTRCRAHKSDMALVLTWGVTIIADDLHDWSVPCLSTLTLIQCRVLRQFFEILSQWLTSKARGLVCGVLKGD